MSTDCCLLSAPHARAADSLVRFASSLAADEQPVGRTGIPVREPEAFLVGTAADRSSVAQSPANKALQQTAQFPAAAAMVLWSAGGGRRAALTGTPFSASLGPCVWASGCVGTVSAEGRNEHPGRRHQAQLHPDP